MTIYDPGYAEFESKRWGHSWISLQNFDFDDIRDIDITDDTVIFTMNPGGEVLRNIRFIACEWPLISFHSVRKISAERNNVRWVDGLAVATYDITSDVSLESFIQFYQEG